MTKITVKHDKQGMIQFLPFSQRQIILQMKEQIGGESAKT